METQESQANKTVNVLRVLEPGGNVYFKVSEDETRVGKNKMITWKVQEKDGDNFCLIGFSLYDCSDSEITKIVIKPKSITAKTGNPGGKVEQYYYIIVLDHTDSDSRPKIHFVLKEAPSVSMDLVGQERPEPPPKVIIN